MTNYSIIHSDVNKLLFICFSFSGDMRSVLPIDLTETGIFL
jgi:hypothetical protein